MLTHRITTTLQAGNSPAVGGAVEIEAGGAIAIAEPVDAQETDLPFAVAVAKLKSLFMLGDVDMTVALDGPTLDEIALAANEPFVWHAESGIPVPFDTNIAGIIVSCDDVGATGTFTLHALIDPT